MEKRKFLEQLSIQSASQEGLCSVELVTKFSYFFRYNTANNAITCTVQNILKLRNCNDNVVHDRDVLAKYLSQLNWRAFTVSTCVPCGVPNVLHAPEALIYSSASEMRLLLHTDNKQS